MIKVCIIGCGRIFSKHYKAIKLNGKIKITGVFDIDTKKNIKINQKLKTKIYKNYNDLIKSEKPDLVTILVESGKHLDICKDVINKNKSIKNFIIEKPIDVSVKKILEFKKIVKKNKINVFTVKQNRFNDAVIKIKKLIDNNYLGKIFMINASCKWRRDQSYYDQAHWRGKKKLDGGVLMNQAIHHIDLLVYFAGKIENVIGFGKTRFIDIESENIAVACLEFKNGCLGTIEATTATSPKDYEGSITIMAEKATVKIGGFASNKIEYFESKKKKIDINKYNQKIKNVYGFGHEKFYDYVVSFLEKKITKNIFDIDNALESVKIVDKIYKSFNSKKIEKV